MDFFRNSSFFFDVPLTAANARKLIPFRKIDNKSIMAGIRFSSL